jgi:hypothetical protein
LWSRLGKAPADKKDSQQNRKYASRISCMCSKLNLIQGHRSPFSVRVRSIWGGCSEGYALMEYSST